MSISTSSFWPPGHNHFEALLIGFVLSTQQPEKWSHLLPVKSGAFSLSWQKATPSVNENPLALVKAHKQVHLQVLQEEFGGKAKLVPIQDALKGEENGVQSTATTGNGTAAPAASGTAAGNGSAAAASLSPVAAQNALSLIRVVPLSRAMKACCSSAS